MRDYQIGVDRELQEEVKIKVGSWQKKGHDQKMRSRL
jgi:hypothetical protein